MAAYSPQLAPNIIPKIYDYHGISWTPEVFWLIV